MAIYHLQAKVISRGSGRSAVAAAAYRHSARMTNERDGYTADFSRKGGSVHSEFAIPANAPAWAKELAATEPAQASEQFWNRVEAFEKRSDAQLAKELILALPKELDREQNIALVREFVAEQLLARGQIANWSFHDAPGNPHIHIMTSLRPLTIDGFGGKKVPVLAEGGQQLRTPKGQLVYGLWAGGKEAIADMRQAWAAIQNRHLELAGAEVRVDHRSYAEQGIELTPTSHVGVRATNIQREAKAEGKEIRLDTLALHEAARRENAAAIAERPEIVLEAISREKSVFDERDVGRYLHRYIDDAVEFQNAMARVMASPETVRIVASAIDPTTGEVLADRYATREMIRLEGTMAAQAHQLMENGAFKVADGVRTEVIAAHSQLSSEQRVAMERITGDERIAAIVGRAGAGKTTMMKAAREAWEAAGYRVLGGALAGKAAEGLQNEANIESRTLASWQIQINKGRAKFDSKTVFVMDEAGMVASKQMAYFVDVVTRTGAKIVLVGDADQLQPIEAGAAFRAITDQIGYAELGTIYRQRQQWMRDASMDLAKGKVGEAITAYQKNGHVVETAVKDDAIKTLVADWIADYDPNAFNLVLAHMRKDVRTLNELARGALLERGQIKAGHSFITEDGERQFAVGEQVVFLRNEGSLGVKNGMIGRVVEADKGKITVEAGDDKRRVEVDQAFYKNIDHGYATTIHKSQGATVNKVKVLATTGLDRHLTYVALTRHRDDVKLYCDKKSFSKVGLVESLSKKGSKETTLDFAGSKLYENALSYANNRGLHGVRVAKALMENQVRWMKEQRAKLETLGERLATFMARFGKVADREAAARLTPQAAQPAAEPWLKGIATWAQSVAQQVETRLTADATVKQVWEDVTRRLANIYEKPEAAMTAMGLVAAVSGSESDRQAALSKISGGLNRDPAAFGAIKGKTGMFVGAPEKEKRAIALRNVAVLNSDIENFVRVRAETEKKLITEVTRERERGQIDIPGLSAQAIATLGKIADVLDKSANATAEAVALASADRAVKDELDKLTTALERRFGERAFLGNREPGGTSFDFASRQVAGSDKSKLAAAWKQFNAAQRLAAAERSEKLIQSQQIQRSLNQGLTR